MAKYISKYACQYGGRVYKPSELLNYNKEEVVCPDCKGKKGVNRTSVITDIKQNEFSISSISKVCKLCKDSGRIDPPHHFDLIGGEEVHAKEEEKGEKVLIAEDKYKEAREATKKEIDNTRSEIKRLGGSYNGTWGLERLKMHLIKVQKENGEKNAIAPKPEVNV